MNHKHAIPQPTATLMKSAWKLLSACPSPNKEGANGGALIIHDDAAVSLPIVNNFMLLLPLHRK
eukprot:15345407-Ditylum_brightwellii.AAC.1